MKINSDEKIKATILYYLRKKRIIWGAHTSFDTLKKGLPSRLGKDNKKIAEQFIKENLIITKPTSYGFQVSLNKEKIQEIEKYIKEVLGFDFV